MFVYCILIACCLPKIRIVDASHMILITTTMTAYHYLSSCLLPVRHGTVECVQHVQYIEILWGICTVCTVCTVCTYVYVYTYVSRHFVIVHSTYYVVSST